MIALFNALCILSGAMALHRQDTDVVVPDKTRTGSALRRGSAMIRLMSTNTGLASTKLRQSERLLEKLGRATMQSNKDQVRSRLTEVLFLAQTFQLFGLG